MYMCYQLTHRSFGFLGHGLRDVTNDFQQSQGGVDCAMVCGNDQRPHLFSVELITAVYHPPDLIYRMEHAGQSLDHLKQECTQ